MADAARRRTQREKIKRTVDMAVPHLDIDTTKVMTDKEIEELQRQTDEWVKSKKLANKLGRLGLQERLRQTVMRAEQLIGSDDSEEED